MKFFAVVLAAATIVAALPGHGGAEPPAGGSNTVTTNINKCNVGKLQCCQQTQTASSVQDAKLLGLIGAAVGGVGALVGLDCNPITGIGASGTSCSAQPVCCKNTKHGGKHGLVGIDCSPINANV